MSEKHVHDCTGPGQTCPCGFKFTVPRYCVEFSVHDNETDTTLVSEAFNTDSMSAVVAAIEDAVHELEAV